MSAAPGLRVQGLRQRFTGQAHDFLHIPTLEVPHGQCLGLAGPSGAGKTTLFHCLAGLGAVQAGRIEWHGLDITTLPPAALTAWRREQLGLIFQDFHLVEGLSALDNVLLPAYFDHWRVPAALRQRGRDLLGAVGMQAFARPVGLLSRGERQRVAFARALLREPAVVMADEPTASLDPEHRVQLGELLLQLVRSRGSTLIVISHEPALLAQMQRVLSVREGQLVADCAAPQEHQA
jgi:putative ABC transport system ATP-binding protein